MKQIYDISRKKQMLYKIFLDLLQFRMKKGHLFAKFENPEK
jgi:hypothetical protein